MTLALASINTERSRHVARIVPFLSTHKPDVVCLQEVMDKDIPAFVQALGAVESYFVPMTRETKEGGGLRGIAILSKLKIIKRQVAYYAGKEKEIFDFDNSTSETKHATSSHMLLSCDIEKEGVVYRIATTHFPWTPNGQADEFQRNDIRSLLSILEKTGEFVLCGDFNAPRGGEVFSILANKYKDNVPFKYTTSIDGTLHRAGPLPHMVDGIFSTPQYNISNVELVSGVSDHCALVAEVTKS